MLTSPRQEMTIRSLRLKLPKRRASASLYVATSVDVERVFSKGRILLSHVRNRLSVQSTRALICLGAWSLMGYVKDSDVKAVTVLPDLKEGEDEEPLSDNWDNIVFSLCSVDTPGPCQTCQTRDPYPKKPGPVLLGYGYGRVRVRVRYFYPRVAREIHYISARSVDLMF